MASFQAKVSCEVQEMEKIKIFVPFRSYPPNNRKFQKNSIKRESNKKKVIVPFRSSPTRNRKFQ